jgi:hypothetical protein
MATDEPIDPPPPPAGDRDGLTESLRQRLETLVPDLVRRTVNAGMGAVFQTEDSLRRLSRELNVPNVAGYLGEAAEGTKEKVLEVVARGARVPVAREPVRRDRQDADDLVARGEDRVRFIPNSERYTGVEPDVKAAVGSSAPSGAAAHRRARGAAGHPVAPRVGVAAAQAVAPGHRAGARRDRGRDRRRRAAAEPLSA